MYYINMKYKKNSVETVDQFETSKEAVQNLIEYCFSDKDSLYWISTRSTKEWRKSQ